jgi:F0F1-type ATP synthase membrane subunit c/vacuolar-type H+-ATPase subunit K
MMKWFQQDEKTDSHRAHRQAQATESTDNGSDNTQDIGGRGRIDLIDLIDFDVHIAVTNNLGIQIFEVTDIVTEWMADSFDAQLEAIGYSGPYADFNTVVLLERGDRDRALQASTVDADGSETATENGELYKAKFKGAALFTRADDQLQVPVEVVESIQRTTLINDVALLEALQISGATGLGSAVIDVRAFVNAVEPNGVFNNNEGGDNLEIVIIIAIIVAAVAFLFLVFAIVWAWRYEKTNRDAYLVNAKDSKDKTGSDPDSSYAESKKLSPKNNTPVQEVDVGFQNDVSLASLPGGYRTESVISDDISTSLSQYYRSGMADHRGFARSNSNHLNDAASISSMESYGYSLDGYSPSLATPQPSDNFGAKERAIGLAQDFDDEPEDDVSIPLNNAAPEDADESVADNQ